MGLDGDRINQIKENFMKQGRTKSKYFVLFLLTNDKNKRMLYNILNLSNIGRRENIDH